MLIIVPGDDDDMFLVAEDGDVEHEVVTVRLVESLAVSPSPPVTVSAGITANFSLLMLIIIPGDDDDKFPGAEDGDVEHEVVTGGLAAEDGCLPPSFEHDTVAECLAADDG